MKVFQPQSMYETIRPLIVANFLVGMSVWPAKANLRTFVNVSYSLICLVSFCVLSKLSMMYVNTYVNKANDFGNLAFLALFYTNVCQTLCLILTGWWSIKIMYATLTRILMCEKAIEQMGINKNYRNLYLQQLYAFGIFLVVFIAFFTANYDTMSKETPVHAKISIMLIIHYPVGILYVTDISFLHWIRYSRIRFEQLNKLLQNMLTTTPDSPQHKRVLKMKDEWNRTTIPVSATQKNECKTKDNTDTMRAVKQIHLELIKCARGTNEAYGLQILLSMTVSFVFITTLLYDAYSIQWIDMSKEEFQQEMISLACWILFYASKVFIINHMCALASIEAANTGDIICELYEPSTSKEFRAEIRDFTLQLIQNPLIFTACGFFNLDHTFIHGVIGSITTYLVILIQVGEIPGQTITSNSTSNITMPHNVTDITMISI